MQTHTLNDLVVDDAGRWDHLHQLIAGNPANQLLAPDMDHAFASLLRLQVRSDSTMGCVVLNTGAILADHGWFRILGSGHVPDLPGIADINGLGDPEVRNGNPGHLVVGFDVLGGQFAIDNGALGITPGHVCYFAPDSLEWESLGGGYPAFVEAALTGALSEAFSPLRWEGWQADIADLPLHMSIASYPPPFSREGQDLSQTAKNPVPTTELLEFYANAAAELNGSTID